MKIAAVALLVCVMVLPARSATIHVPGDYSMISQAVAAAAAGDSVTVGPGTYADPATINIAVPLTLYSTAGLHATFLDGQNARRIVFCSSPGVFIRGFFFVNGFGAVTTPRAVP